jgi:hypothetical protein
MISKFETLGVEEFDEFRWNIVKSLLDEYPALKKKVKTYVVET